MIYTVWIINKAGGLIYQKTIRDGFHPKSITSNDYLIMASTFQSVHAISSQVGPEAGMIGSKVGGIRTVQWNASGPEADRESFQMHCLHTLTGLKIVLTTSLGHPQIEVALRKVYEIYADYALKNPFHALEMPVRSELFDTHLLKALTAL